MSMVRRGCGNFSTNSYVAFTGSQSAPKPKASTSSFHIYSSASIVAVCCRQLAILVTAIELGKLSSFIISALNHLLKCGGAVKQYKLQRSGGCGEIHHHHLLLNLLEHINNIILCVSIVQQRVVLLQLSVNRRCCIDHQFYQAVIVIHHSKDTVMSEQTIY